VAELQKALGDKAAVEREKAAAEAAAAEQQRLHELSNNALQQQMQQLSANISSKEALIQQLARNELEARELNQVYQVGVLAGMGGGSHQVMHLVDLVDLVDLVMMQHLVIHLVTIQAHVRPVGPTLHQGEAPTHYGGRWLISLGNVSLHGMMAGGSHFRVAGPCRWPTQTLSPV